MITVFIDGRGSEEQLTLSVESVLQQPAEFHRNTPVVVLTDAAGKESVQKILVPYEQQMNIQVLVYDGNPGMAVSQELTKRPSEYFSVIRSGEAYHLDALARVSEYLENNREQTDVVLLRNLRKNGDIPKTAADAVSGRVATVETIGSVIRLPGCLRGAVFATDAAMDCMEFLSLEDGGFEQFLYAVIEKKLTIAYVKNAFFSGNTPIADTDAVFEEWSDGQWYFNILENYCLKVLERYSGHAMEPFVQAQVLFVLKTQFAVNGGNKNKEAFSEEEREQYFALCKRCLKKLSNKCIFATKRIHRERKMTYGMKSALMAVKHAGNEPDLFIEADENEVLHVCRREEENPLETGLVPIVTLDLLEYEKGCLKADVAVDQFLISGGLKLKAVFGKEEGLCEQVERFAQTKFFGIPVAKKATYRICVPVEKLKRKQILEFVLEDEAGRQMVLPILTAEYQSKLTRRLKSSYWTFDRYKVTLKRVKGPFPWGLVIVRSGKFRNFVQELKVLKEMLTASYGSKRMFAMRCLYWLTYPVYSKKNIWLTFDKLYKGGDCGEYFYKYMCSRKDTDVIPAYVIREDVPDADRLKQEGYEILPYHSWKQRLMYLHAKMIFATHSGVHSFCGFSKWEVRFIQDRIKAVNTCIQHGLSVQDLTFDSNRIVNNNKRYYCASRHEVENLSKPAYDYDPEVLRLTGIPRYDGLVNKDKKQILITPTWRSYIAMPAVMGESRPYNPEFKNTDYYKIFQSLLENKKLSEAASKNGYKVIYLLHPVISSQIEDFRPANDIEIITALDVNYEKILTESSLMVTDYSGVQFDFAYMRKPVVYFHPPKLPPHYEEGGFFYDTQGFGEICKETEELVEVLCEYMEQGCKLKEFYKGRQDDFFAFDDLESCRRIYEDALQFQKERKSE